MKTSRFSLWMGAVLLGLLCGSSASGAGQGDATAQVVPIDWTRFQPGLPDNEDAKVCSRILLNSIRYNLGWAETIIPVIAESGHLLTGLQAHDTIRPACTASMAFAAAIRTGIYDENAVGLPLQDARQRTVELIKVTAAAHRKKPSWNYEWQASFWAALLGEAGWMLWEDLDAETRELVVEMVLFQANRISNPGNIVPYWNGVGGDSKAEENAWYSMITHTAVAMLPGHSNAAMWREAGTRLMVSAFARQSDDESNATVLDGRPVKDWLDGFNLREDGVVINKGILHPNYMTCFKLNLHTFLVQPLAGQASSETADFNAALVYRTMVATEWQAPPHQAPGGTIYVPGKPEIYYPQGYSDGSPFSFESFYGVDVYAHLLAWDKDQARPAAEWMRLRAAKTLEMQARHPDGHLFAMGEYDQSIGREQQAVGEFAGAWMCFWLHAQGKLGQKTNWLSSPNSTPIIQSVPSADPNPIRLQ